MTHIYTDYGMLAELYPVKENERKYKDIFMSLEKMIVQEKIRKSKNKETPKNKELAFAYKGGKCLDCGVTPQNSRMEFHHLRDKKFNIGAGYKMSWPILKLELDKCVLLCLKCHRNRHSKAGRKKFGLTK